MSRASVVKTYGFLKGLQTKRTEDGRTLPDEFVTFQNVRTSRGGVYKRAGMGLVAALSSDNTSIDLNGSTQFMIIFVDPRIHQFGLRWTWEALVSPDAISADHFIFGQAFGGTTNGLTVKFNSSGNVVAVVTDSAGTSTTLTSSATYAAATTHDIQITRNGAALVMNVNGAQAATGTMSATLLGRSPATNLQVGAHLGADHFDGKVDYVRFFNIVRPRFDDLRLRWTDPRCVYCLFCYTGEIVDAGGLWCLDHSRYEGHANVVAGTATGTALAIQDAQVTGIFPRLDRSGAQRIFVASGGRIHNVAGG